MTELDNLRQEAEALKNAIRDARKVACDTSLIQESRNLEVKIISFPKRSEKICFREN